MCDRLHPVAATVAAISQPGYYELVRYSGVLGNLATQAYQGPDADANLGNLLGNAATELGLAAVNGWFKSLELAQDELRQAIAVCPASSD